LRSLFGGKLEEPPRRAFGFAIVPGDGLVDRFGASVVKIGRRIAHAPQRRRAPLLRPRNAALSPDASAAAVDNNVADDLFTSHGLDAEVAGQRWQRELEFVVVRAAISARL